MNKTIRLRRLNIGYLGGLIMVVILLYFYGAPLFLHRPNNIYSSKYHAPLLKQRLANITKDVTRMKEQTTKYSTSDRHDDLQTIQNSVEKIRLGLGSMKKIMFDFNEIGDCKNNGDSDAKKLSRDCGCEPLPPDPDPSKTMVHPCCRNHLRKMMRDVYREAISLHLPLVLTGGSVIGWKRNRSLIPYDLDLDAKLEEEEWYTIKYFKFILKLADLGYCVWFRANGWTKIWSSVIGFDVWKWSKDRRKPENLLVQDTHSGWDGHVYKRDDIYPVRQATLEGTEVLLPNHPERYLDQAYGVGQWETPRKCTRIEDRKCIE